MTYHFDSSGPPLRSDDRAPQLDEMSPYEVLLGAIDEVIAEWRAQVRLEPWSRIPDSRLVNSFPEILPRIIRLAQGGATHIDDDLKSRITDEHGFLRRGDDIPLLAVAEEWSHLKRACWAVLERRHLDLESIQTAMTRMDTLVDDAMGYTLRGYYRPELDMLRGRGLERRDSGVDDRRRGSGDRRGRDDDPS
ncbi:MAG TPA: hypothetical protein VFS05_02755 [Gemmatimonadaceae bacterium]|nr:hypothetical protein [Gemmatimonadaceae bacterium]